MWHLIAEAGSPSTNTLGWVGLLGSLGSAGAAVAVVLAFLKHLKEVDHGWRIWSESREAVMTKCVDDNTKALREHATLIGETTGTLKKVDSTLTAVNEQLHDDKVTEETRRRVLEHAEKTGRARKGGD